MGARGVGAMSTDVEAWTAILRLATLLEAQYVDKISGYTKRDLKINSHDAQLAWIVRRDERFDPNNTGDYGLSVIDRVPHLQVALANGIVYYTFHDIVETRWKKVDGEVANVDLYFFLTALDNMNYTDATITTIDSLDFIDIPVKKNHPHDYPVTNLYLRPAVNVRSIFP